MALSKKLLSRDEVVVRHMHTHIKVLLWRFNVEILLFVVGVVASLRPAGRAAAVTPVTALAAD